MLFVLNVLSACEHLASLQPEPGNSRTADRARSGFTSVLQTVRAASRGSAGEQEAALLNVDMML